MDSIPLDYAIQLAIVLVLAIPLAYDTGYRHAKRDAERDASTDRHTDASSNSDFDYRSHDYAFSHPEYERIHSGDAATGHDGPAR